MSEVALARQYILGFLMGLKLVGSDRYAAFNEAWGNIDQIDEEDERHRKTIGYYKSLAFPFGCGRK